MHLFQKSGLRPTRGAVPTLALALFAWGAISAGAADATTNHADAMGALNDLEAVIGSLTASANLNSSGASQYRQAAQQALDGLVGNGGPGYKPEAGSAADADGVLGHVNRLLALSGTHAWDATIRGVYVNATIAERRLKDALTASDLGDFQAKTTSVLEALIVARGSAADVSSLGGLLGAIGNTDLGVPPDATVVSGCAPPVETPSYGTANGHLIYVAIPKKANATRLPLTISVRDVTVRNNSIVFHTAASGLVGTLCSDQAMADAGKKVASKNASTKKADPPPKLYTEAQAQQGKPIFANSCAVCHGDNLQGKSGPAIAGSAFLKRTRTLNWSIDNLRSVVENTMPRSNPGSLSKKQYADVLAYLLAANCYPAGNKKFPTKDSPELKKAELKPPKNVTPDNPDLGTCVPQQKASR